MGLGRFVVRGRRVRSYVRVESCYVVLRVVRCYCIVVFLSVVFLIMCTSCFFRLSMWWSWSVLKMVLLLIWSCSSSPVCVRVMMCV